MQKENIHAVPRPKDRSKPILIENHSCSPEQGDKTKRAKSRLCKQIRRIAIDRTEKQVKLAKRCEQLILLTRNFVGSAGRVLKMFNESTRENDINLKIFLNQKLSLSEYLDDLDKQVSNIRSDDIDMSKQNEQLRLEIDRLSKALRRQNKESAGKDPREKIHQELRRDELDTLKRFVRERMQTELLEFNRLLDFTEKEYRLKLIMFQKDRQLTREKQSELNEMIKFVRGEYQQQILGKQYSQRIAVLSQTGKSNNEEKALSHKIKELLKYLKVDYVECKPNNSMFLLEMLELKLYNLKIELLPTIRRQNDAYTKEIKQLRAEIQTLTEDNRRLAGSKVNIVHLEDQVRTLREELFKIEQVKEPQYFSSNQQHLRNAERERAELQKQNHEIKKQLTELEKEKIRLEGIVSKVFEQLQSVCVNNNLIKREQLRELNYQGLMDIIQRSIGENKEKDRENREERRRIENIQQHSTNKIVQMEKDYIELDEEFEMVLSQKLQLEEHIQRTRATNNAEMEQLKNQLKRYEGRQFVTVESQTRYQDRPLVTAQSQTQVDSARWDDMQRQTDSLKQTTFKQSRELSQKLTQLQILEDKYEETRTALGNNQQEVIHLNNCLGQAKSELQAHTYRSQELMMALNDKEKQYSEATALVERIASDLKQVVKNKENMEARLKEEEAYNQQLNETKDELTGKLEILSTMVTDRDELIGSLRNRIIDMEQEEKRTKLEGKQLQHELMETTSQIKELKDAYENVSRQLTTKKSMLESVEHQLEQFEADSRAKSVELSNIRSSQQLYTSMQQAEVVERLEGQVEAQLRQLQAKQDEITKLKHQTISLTILEEENMRIKKELQAQQAMVVLLDTELTSQIKLKEEVNALKQAIQQLEQELNLKSQELERSETACLKLQCTLRDIQTTFKEQLQDQALKLYSTLEKSLGTLQLKVGSISLRLNGLSRKQSVRSEEHNQTKQMLVLYSSNCSRLHVEINRLVAQLEQFRSKAELERNRKLEDAVRSSQKLKYEKKQLSESMQLSRVLIEQQESKIKQYEMQLSQYSSLQQSMFTPDKGELHHSGDKVEDNAQLQLQSCSKIIDFRSIMINTRDFDVQTDPVVDVHDELQELRNSVTDQLNHYGEWMSEAAENCARQLKALTDKVEERSMELVRVVGRKFKISYTAANVLEQTIRFVNEFEPERKQPASNYFEVLERLVEELLFSRVNLNLQQQLKTLQPSEKDKILGYRKKIADLQFQLSSKDELNEKLRTLEAEIVTLKADIKAKEKRIGYYESEVNEKDNQIAQLKTKKPQPFLNLSEQSQSLFLMIEEDLLDKDFVTTSAESLNELLDQSGICSDELGFTKAELTKCLRENTSLREKLRNARHHLKRIIDLIESHSGGSQTNAKIYEAVLSCRSTLS